jgi:hypothetical protein
MLLAIFVIVGPILSLYIAISLLRIICGWLSGTWTEIRSSFYQGAVDEARHLQALRQPYK